MQQAQKPVINIASDYFVLVPVTLLIHFKNELLLHAFENIDSWKQILDWPKTQCHINTLNSTMTLKSNESQIKVYASKNYRGYSTSENNFTFSFDNMTYIMPILGWERKKISLLLLYPFKKKKKAERHTDPFSKVAENK